MTDPPLWPMAAETIANFRRRYERLSATIASVGGLIDQDIQAQLAAMEQAVAHQDIERLHVLADGLLSILDRLEAGGLSRRQGDVPGSAPYRPGAPPSSAPPEGAR